MPICPSRPSVAAPPPQKPRPVRVLATYPGNARPITHKVQVLARRGRQSSQESHLTLARTATYVRRRSWCDRCIAEDSPAALGELGGTVTVIYSAQSAVPQKARVALLPLLIVLFLVSYAILTLLVVEQGRTIEAQRGLLREMWKDSTQLATLKSRIARQELERAQSQPAGQPAVQQQKKPADTANSGSVPPKAPARGTRRPGKSARSLKQVPERPAADLQDVRRSTHEI